MTFEQLIAIVRECQSTMTPEQRAQGDREPFGIRNRRLATGTSIDINTVLVVAAGEEPVPVPEPPSERCRRATEMYRG